MKTPLAILVHSIAALSLLSGCGKKEDPVKIIEQAEAKLPPAEQMPPDARAEAKAPATAAAQRTASVPDTAFLSATQHPSPATASGDADYEAWFKKYQLDLNDPKMLDA